MGGEEGTTRGAIPCETKTCAGFVGDQPTTQNHFRRGMKPTYCGHSQVDDRGVSTHTEAGVGGWRGGGGGGGPPY